MSNRSVRKKRHYTKTLTFKERVHLGQVAGQLERGEVAYSDIPDWMKNNLAAEYFPVPPEPLELDAPEPIHKESETEHIHGPGCNHGH